MFNQLFNLYDISITWIIIISVIILIVFAYFSVKEKFGYTFLGILRIIASIFYSPIIYFKNCFVGLAQFGQKGDSGLTGSKQYLLNKFLIILEGLLILLGVFILGSGLVASWNAFLPPKYLREQVDNTEKMIHQMDSTYQFAKTSVDKLDNEWNSQKTQLINNYKTERQQKRETSIKDNSRIESQLSSLNYFMMIKNYLDQKSSLTNRYMIESVRSDVEKYVANNTPAATTDQKTEMNNYCNNWVTIKLSDAELSSFSETDLRNTIQSNYSMLKNEMEYSNNMTNSYSTSLKQLKAEVKYNFVALLIGILTTLITFLFYVWLIGLMLEMIFLMVDLSANVRAIRINQDDKTSLKS